LLVQIVNATLGKRSCFKTGSSKHRHGGWKLGGRNSIDTDSPRTGFGYQLAWRLDHPFRLQPPLGPELQPVQVLSQFIGSRYIEIAATRQKRSEKN
jgi:hypothetical protein